MTAESDIAAIADAGANPASDVRTALTSLLTPPWMHNLHVRPSAAHADDDEFNGTSLDGSWTKLTTSGTFTTTVSSGVLSGVFNGQTANDCNAILKSISSGTNLTIDIAWRGLSNGTNYFMLGPVFSIGTTTTSNVIWQMTYWGAIPVTDIRGGTFTNIGNDYSNPGTGFAYNLPNSHYYQRFEYNSTSGFKQWWSPDGISFSSFNGGYVSNPLGGSPTHYGIGFSSWGGVSENLFSIDYFRVTAT